eukprot:SM000062S19887  [mRNA]  locus=s62:138655:140841:- [translate_table: standard]
MARQVGLSAFAFLFSELVQYSQARVSNVPELERKLEDAGYGVGLRMLELLCHREKATKGTNIAVNEVRITAEISVKVQQKGSKRETRLLQILTFVHSSVWKALFGKVADSLEKSTEHEDEYMISERELLVNRFVSVPRDMGSFNCGAFVAGIVKAQIFLSPTMTANLLRPTVPLASQGVLDNAGFPARVTAHFVAVEGQARPRTTILIKFSEEVLLREARLG